MTWVFIPLISVAATIAVDASGMDSQWEKITMVVNCAALC